MYRGSGILTRSLGGIFIGILLASAPIQNSHAQAGLPARSADELRRVALATYVHGMTAELAQSLVAPEAVPELRRLLHDPSFPRRDNVVAMLAFLDGRPGTESLLASLATPPAPPHRPEEDRALLLTPQVLGHLARRGDDLALEALLSMTSHGSEGGPLRRAAAARGAGSGLRDDLVEAALRGLSLSGSESARERLADVAAGRVRISPRGRDLGAAARDALEQLELRRDGNEAPQRDGPEVDAGPEAAGLVDLTGTAQPDPGDMLPAVLDTQSRVHEAGLTYANHVALTATMTDARLDTVLGEASKRMGRGDYSTDIACCSTVRRSAAGTTFGSSGDGLDVIDTSAELQGVLGNSRARVQVVRAINYCGGSGTNIIGCAWQPGNGMAVVRLTSTNTEAVLWIHEYGHNTGLSHSTDSKALMYGTNYGTNNGLSQSECSRYHNPSAGTGMSMVDRGVCEDGDGDEVHDVIDNCDSAVNFDQADADADGIGDACESEDGDGDGTPDAQDCAPSDPSAAEPPTEVASLRVEPSAGGITLSWTSQGSGVRYDVAGDTLAELRSTAGTSGAGCRVDDLTAPSWEDTRSGPPADEGWYYLVRAQNACGAGIYGRDSSGQEIRPSAACP